MDRKKKKRNEDRLLKKRIAERKRYERIKTDPHKSEIQRIKERQKYLRKKANKERMEIKEMTPTQQRQQRAKWREYSRTYRRKHRLGNRKLSSESNRSDEAELPSECEIELPENSRSIFVKLEEDMLTDAEDLLAEFQAHEEEEFGAAARAHTSALEASTPSREPRIRVGKTGLRVAASAPPPLPPSAHPLMWPEEPTPRLRPGLNADECQIFGDFVASELRTLRSDESRKKLKRMIQKAILQIGEEEDMNTMGG